MKNRDILKYTGLLLVGLGLFASLIFFAEISWTTFLAKAKKFSATDFLIIQVLSVIFFYLTSLRWKNIITSLPAAKLRTFKLGFFFYYSSLGYLSNNFLPSYMGNVGVKAAALKLDAKEPLKTSFYSIFLEHAFDFVVLLLLAVPAVLFINRTIAAETGIILSFGLAGLITALFGFFPQLFSEGAKFILNSFSRLWLKVSFFSKRYPLNIQLDWIDGCKIDSINILILTILKSIIVILRYYVIFRALEIELSPIAFILCASAGNLIGLIDFTPGGIGVSQIGWAAVLSLVGVSIGEAAFFGIFQLILTEISVSVVLACSAAVYHWSPRAVTKAPQP